MIGRKRKISQRNERTLYLMCIRPTSNGRPLVLQKFGTSRDLEFPTINKFMKDASKRFFDMAQNHPNPFIVSAASNEPPPAHHFLRRPRNVLSDLPDAFNSEVEKLSEAKNMQIDNTPLRP
ncbi:hypothetical protein EVAR_82946_1 [Eumeta japonica]|uniref:Uncharacterized protein n=1 Tax=Eumeta variegata TaxID=151549 RepID=A0A4C1X4G0_EUMVA|nr:hypothetical protein EVAR_82946_1 [Eumeta japonica]